MGESDAVFMRRAVALARSGVDHAAGGPFGAVVVRDGGIVGAGYNRVVSSCDPTAHAEVVAMRAACRRLRVFHLDDCTLYTTCEPCPMCLAAAYWAHVRRIVYATTRADAAAAGFDDGRIDDELALPSARRSIPMVSVGRDAALPLFERWRNRPGMTRY